MKCSHENCKEESTTMIGWGTNDRGSVPLCKHCLNKYLEHERARNKLLIEGLEKDIKKVIKKGILR